MHTHVTTFKRGSNYPQVNPYLSLYLYLVFSNLITTNFYMSQLKNISSLIQIIKKKWKLKEKDEIFCTKSQYTRNKKK